MKEWIKIVIACVSFAFTITVFIYTNFETKADANGFYLREDYRLGRIEQKIDWLIEKSVND